MVVLDFSIVIVALSSIQRDLGVSAATVQWVVTGYAIAFGGLLILGGRAGDLYGRRRLFLAGIAVFTAASLAGGLARGPVLLIASRVVQGSGPRWSRPPHCHSSPRASPSTCRCSRSRSWNPGARRPRHRPLPNSPPTEARLTARWSRDYGCVRALGIRSPSRSAAGVGRFGPRTLRVRRFCDRASIA
ncbi:MFS transporter [Streptomyces mirabilis]|uniref:MFS transporter n=1 Tax=Streptomyces mirabilis TaxID=68239 RepID=UPI00378F7A82